MKLKTILALPVCVLVDLCTVGMAEATEQLLSNDRFERDLEAFERIAKVMCADEQKG